MTITPEKEYHLCWNLPPLFIFDMQWDYIQQKILPVSGSVSTAPWPLCLPWTNRDEQLSSESASAAKYLPLIYITFSFFFLMHYHYHHNFFFWTVSEALNNNVLWFQKCCLNVDNWCFQYLASQNTYTVIQISWVKVCSVSICPFI